MQVSHLRGWCCDIFRTVLQRRRSCSREKLRRCLARSKHHVPTVRSLRPSYRAGFASKTPRVQLRDDPCRLPGRDVLRVLLPEAGARPCALPALVATAPVSCDIVESTADGWSLDCFTSTEVENLRALIPQTCATQRPCLLSLWLLLSCWSTNVRVLTNKLS